MPATDAQRKFLTFYRECRRQGGPSLLRLFAGPVFLSALVLAQMGLGVLLLVVAQGAAGLLLGGSLALATFGVGLLLGAGLNSFKGVRQFVQAWPAIEQVTDWQRVDQL